MGTEQHYLAQAATDGQKKTIENLFLKQRAHYAVAKAKKQGKLPKLDGSIPCTDCGHPADRYDHRDYRKPLEVEPVCYGCNWNRGHDATHKKPNCRCSLCKQQASK